MILKKRKKDKDIKVLTEKEIQEKLYGDYVRPPEDSRIAAQRKAREQLAKEKDAEYLKRKGVEEELEKLRAELEQTQREISRISKEKRSLERSLSKVMSEKEAELHARPKVTIASSRTIFNVAVKIIITLLMLLVIVVASVKLISLRANRGQIKQEPAIIGERELALPYTIQVCVYEKKDEAESLVSDLEKKGYPAWLVSRTSPKGKIYHNIYIGRFATKKEASNFLDSVKDKEIFKEFKDSFVKLYQDLY